MSLTYTTYVSQLANLMAVSSADSNFTTFLPGCVDYAEQRCYRDLNLLSATVVSTSVAVAANARSVALPTTVTGSTGGFLTVTAVNVYNGAGTVRSQLARSWQDFIDFLYPSNTSSATTSLPLVYAVVGSTSPATPGVSSLLMGPTVGVNAVLEVTGTIRPAALSAGNTSTILAAMYSDLFMAASMVFAAGYMRDFGSQADDPRISQSWETQYQALLQSVIGEQGRARYNTSLPTGPTAGSAA